MESLPEAKIDHHKSKKIWSNYDMEIINMMNPQEEELTKLLIDIRMLAEKHRRKRIGKRRTKGGIVLLVYFAGHGCMIRGFSHIIFNEPERNMRNPFPLEKKMRDLCSDTDGDVFPIIIFDCCR